MPVADTAIIASSSVLAIAGFVMEAAAVRAYFQTERSVMLPLAVGFGLIVAASLTTVGLIYIGEFRDYRLMLFVQNGVAMFGYLFVVASIVFYKP